MEFNVNGVKLKLFELLFVLMIVFFMDSFGVWCIGKLLGFIFGFTIALGFAKSMAIIGVVYFIRFIFRIGKIGKVENDE